MHINDQERPGKFLYSKSSIVKMSQSFHCFNQGVSLAQMFPYIFVGYTLIHYVRECES